MPVGIGYSWRDLFVHYPAAAVATAAAALALNSSLTFVVGMIPSSNLAGALFLALAGILTGVAFRLHPGRESLMDLPGIAMVAAFVLLLGSFVPMIAIDVSSANALAGSGFASLGRGLLLLAEAYFGLAIAKMFTRRFVG